jgi:hypothetical protein
VIKDPLTVWNGQFPYDALDRAGITPESSQSDVEEASFTLMTGRMMTPAAQKAWHELRDIRRRLLVDLLLYDVGPDIGTGQAREKIQPEPADPGETSPGPLPPAGLGDFPSQHFIDSLIHFDR